jgi:hypothetical protein
MKAKEAKTHETIIKREYEKPVLILIDTSETQVFALINLLNPTTGAAS